MKDLELAIFWTLDRPRKISFIAEFPSDCPVDQITAHYLRSLYADVCPDGPIGVLLRLLWPRNGLFFTNDRCIQDACMLIALKPVPGLPALELFRDRFSRLQRHLEHAMATKQVKEAHLIALFFILDAARWSNWIKEKFDWERLTSTFLGAIVTFMTQLKSQSDVKCHYYEFWPFILSDVIIDVVDNPESPISKTSTYPVADNATPETLWAIFSLWRDLGLSIEDSFPSFHAWHGFRFSATHEIFFSIRACLVSYFITPLTGGQLSHKRRHEIETALTVINERISRLITTHETVITLLDPLVCLLPKEYANRF